MLVDMGHYNDDGEYTAVVDNVEDGLATVFFERDGEEEGNAV